MHPANSIVSVLKSARSPLGALLLLCMLCGMQVVGQGTQPTRRFYQVDNGVTYAVWVYETPGTFVFTPPAGVTSVDYLLVGGGGGGAGQGNSTGYFNPGGGGAGGVLQATYTLSNAPYTILVGAGGLGSADTGPGANGANSTAFGFTALGGGGGGGVQGLVGGSGGGGGYHTQAGGSGTVGQGTQGGASTAAVDSNSRSGGGGGGAGFAGANAVSGVGGTGGIGLDFSPLFSSNVGVNGWFAGGGGGSSQNNQPGAGGTGGGGNGATSGSGQIGLPGTGGGGGGASSVNGLGNQSAIGGNGGSGVVIVRYVATPGPPEAAQSTLLASPSFGLLANNSDQAQLQLTLRDANGVQNMTTVHDVFFSTTLGTVSASQFINGVYLSTMQSPTSGTATITAYLGTDASGALIGSALVHFIDPSKYRGGIGRGDVASTPRSSEALTETGPPVVAQATLAARNFGSIANNTDQAPIWVMLRDANGVQITNAVHNVFLTTNLGNLIVSPVAGSDSAYTYVGDGTNGTLGEIYVVHIFRQHGHQLLQTSSPLHIDYLLVAGGGGGGSDVGGGGGAGGVLQGSILLNANRYNLFVGGGGMGALPLSAFPPPGANGGNSTAFGFTAIGGGGGSSGHRNVSQGPPPSSGGSGGGSSARMGVVPLASGAAGTPLQGTSGGNAGSSSTPIRYFAGGGGGAASNTEVNGVINTRSGHGGNGRSSLIMGAPYLFGGGGGGASHDQGLTGNGGLGGGGGGGRAQNGPPGPGTGGTGGLNNGFNGLTTNGGNGGSNTGGGGGGGSIASTARGGGGGSGIIIIRYKLSEAGLNTGLTASMHLLNGEYKAMLQSPTAGTATITAYLGTDPSGALIGTVPVLFIDQTKYRGGTGRGDVASAQMSAQALVATAPPLVLQSTLAAHPRLGLVANNADEALIALVLRDSNGVQVTTPNDVFLTTSLATLSAIQFINGAYQSTLKTPTAGTATITAYLGTSASGILIGTASVHFIDQTKYRGGMGRGDVASARTSSQALVETGPPVVAQSTLVAVPPWGLLANNVDEAHILAIIRDANGVQITNTPFNVFLSTTLGSLNATQFINGAMQSTLKTPTAGRATITGYLGTSASGSLFGSSFVDFINPAKYQGGTGRGDFSLAPANVFSLVANMALTVNTQASGASADRTVALPLRGNTNVLIDWGDGSTTSVIHVDQTADVLHTYANDGVYGITLIGLLSQFGNGTAAGYAHANKIMSIDLLSSHDLISLSGAFNGATNLTQVPPYLMPNITNLSAAFKGAIAFNQDISGWNIASVTDMSDMFLGVTLSPEVYSPILIRWGAQLVQSNVSFHGGNSKYFLSDAMLGRKKLTDPLGSLGYNWTITDGGPILPDASIWYVPETGLVNKGFSAGLFLKYNNGQDYLYSGEITIRLASGTATLSGGVIATSKRGQFSFRELVLDTAGVYTFEAFVPYHHNGPQTYITTVSSSITMEQSAYFGGLGRGEALSESLMMNLEGKLRLTVGGTFAVANKVFDGTRVATFLTNNLVLVGVVAPDTVIGTFTAFFDGPAIGFNKTVNAVASLSGPAMAKYFVSYFNAPTTTANITGAHYFGGEGKGDMSSGQLLTDLNGLKFYQWVGGASGSPTDWFTAANWDRNLLPGADDGILILPRPHLPELMGVSPAQDVVRDQRTLIASGSSLRLKGSSPQFAQLFRVNAGGTLETESSARVILEPGARYLNLSSSSPMLEAQQRLTGVKGWRMLSSPVRTTYADWLDSLETAGYTGAKYPTLQPNVMWFAETDTGTTNQSWRLPVGATDTLVSGRGHYAYVFNGAARPGVALNFNDRLPKTLIANGREPVLGPGDTFTFNPSFTPRSRSTTPADTAAGGVFFLEEEVADAGWNLLGNPTASVLNWNAVAGWTKTNLHETIYIWDPNFASGAGGYRYWNGSLGNIDTSLGSGLLAPYQAFWVHALGANPQLSLRSEAKSELGQHHIGRTAAAPPHISFTLEGHGMEAQTFVSFGADAKTGPDGWDAYQLDSYNNDWLMLFTRSSTQHRKPLVINHLPDDFKNELAIPLLLSAARNHQPLSGNYKLTWKLSDNWPVHWQVALMDHHRELAIPMWQYNQHVFNYEAPARIQARTSDQEGADFRLPQGTVIHGSGVLNAHFRQQQEPIRPFTIVIIPETTMHANLVYRPDHPYLFPPTPNPFSSETKLSFYLPEGSEAVLEVLDMYGRRLYRSTAARYGAGMHDVLWETSALAAATYVVRLLTPTYTSTQRAVKMDR